MSDFWRVLAHSNPWLEDCRILLNPDSDNLDFRLILEICKTLEPRHPEIKFTNGVMSWYNMNALFDGLFGELRLLGVDWFLLHGFAPGEAGCQRP